VFDGASNTTAGAAVLPIPQCGIIGIVSAKLDAGVAPAASGVPQGGMNYAVKSR
jgi:hypothetical protein